LNLEFTNITSPVDGRTSRANVTEGNLVNAGDPVLTTVVSTDKVYAYFDASEALYLKYMRAAREGTRASSRDTPNVIYLGLANEQGFPHEGKMDCIAARASGVREQGRLVHAWPVRTPEAGRKRQIHGHGRYGPRADHRPDTQGRAGRRQEQYR
jgi:multidrug efflux pump subunit AcrA (membrane-fusion protein)